jgi:hypothetical protein
MGTPNLIREIRGTSSLLDIHPGRCQGISGSKSTQLWAEQCPALAFAGRVLPGNLPKIRSQDLPSLLYASKRCWYRSDHRLCLLVPAHLSIIAAARIRIAFAQTTVVIAASRLSPFGPESFAIRGFSKLELASVDCEAEFLVKWSLRRVIQISSLGT